MHLTTKTRSSRLPPAVLEHHKTRKKFQSTHLFDGSNTRGGLEIHLVRAVRQQTRRLAHGLAAGAASPHCRQPAKETCGPVGWRIKDCLRVIQTRRMAQARMDPASNTHVCNSFYLEADANADLHHGWPSHTRTRPQAAGGVYDMAAPATTENSRALCPPLRIEAPSMPSAPGPAYST